MKKLMLTICLVLGLLIAPMAMADTLKVNQGPYSSGLGGEFVVVESGLSFGNYASTTKYDGGFATFCVEKGETFSPGTTYAYEITQKAMYGGKYPDGDPISKGTAWLYSQFANGTLGGYEYVNASQRKLDAGLLQQTIWFLEGEGIDPGGKFDAALIIQFGSIEAAMENDVNGAYGVSVINLWDVGYVGVKDHQHQDQLVLVPEPGILILLGIAMSAIGAASWRLRKI